MAGFIPFAVWPPATGIRVPEYSMADSPLDIQRWNGRQRAWIFKDGMADSVLNIQTLDLQRCFLRQGLYDKNSKFMQIKIV